MTSFTPSLTRDTDPIAIRSENHRAFIGQAVTARGHLDPLILLGEHDNAAVVIRFEGNAGQLANAVPFIAPWGSAESPGVFRMDRAGFSLPPATCSVLLNQHRRIVSINRHRDELSAKIDAIVERAHEEANERDWCSDYDDIIEELGLPSRQRSYTVETVVNLSIQVSVPVTAKNADDAVDRVDRDLSDSDIADAVNEYLERNGGSIDSGDIENRDARDAELAE